MNQPSATDHGELGRLAGDLGVQTWYWDTQGRRRDATPDGLVAVLRALGAPVATGADLGELRRFVESGRVRPVEPVVVGHEGEPVEIDVRAPVVGGSERVVVHLQPDGTAPLRFEIVLDEMPEVERIAADGREHAVRRVRLDLGPTVGVGYHPLTVELGGALHATTLIVAPRRVPAPGPAERTWGVFAALYGCRPDDIYGPTVGDLTRLGSWVEGLGGRVVATLPILATYLSQPYDPSPYAPVSQRYWNELYLDLAATPELAASERARALLDDPVTRQAAEQIRTADLFDHRGRYALVRPVLDELAATCMAGARRRPRRLRPLGRRAPRRRPLRAVPRRHRPDGQRVARVGPRPGSPAGRRRRQPRGGHPPVGPVDHEPPAGERWRPTSSRGTSASTSTCPSARAATATTPGRSRPLRLGLRRRRPARRLLRRRPELGLPARAARRGAGPGAPPAGGVAAPPPERGAGCSVSTT